MATVYAWNLGAGDFLIRFGWVWGCCEFGELLGISRCDQQVAVIRQDDDRVHDHPIQSLGAAEDAEDGLVDRWSRLQEQPAVDGSGGDLDQGSRGRDMAERTGHAEPPL
jgi:hypothetical protein